MCCAMHNAAQHGAQHGTAAHLCQCKESVWDNDDYTRPGILLHSTQFPNLYPDRRPPSPPLALKNPSLLPDFDTGHAPAAVTKTNAVMQHVVVTSDLLLKLLFLLDVLLQLILQTVVPAFEYVVLAFQLHFTELCRLSQLHADKCIHTT